MKEKRKAIETDKSDFLEYQTAVLRWRGEWNLLFLLYMIDSKVFDSIHKREMGL